LFAKKNNGDFILRIEDTDQNRFVPGAEDYIIESLKWSGINYNEGVGIGGDHEPYRQSERKAMYKQYADKLLAEGKAYYAFDSAEELDNLRKAYESEKKTFQYDSKTRGTLNNSLTINADEVNKKINSGENYVIRIKIPENETVIVNDIIRGKVEVSSNQLDDKVLFKSDGMPTYHLANVVDDYLMKISHVIRGEEWLPSAPLHVLLYRYLGWENEMPVFAHLPLLLKPDGNGKLSKRDGDRLGFPVFPLKWTDPKTGEVSSGYRESGYFPEAFVNMLAFLGWNPGTTQEIFSIEELAKEFSIERIAKHGAKFDLEKAKWFNHQYLQMKTDDELAEMLMPVLHEKGIAPEKSFVTKICGLVKERASFIKDLADQSIYFFVAPQSFNEAVIKKRWQDNTAEVLTKISVMIEGINPFDKTLAETTVKEYLYSNDLNMGNIMNCLRLTIVGESMGPDIFTIIEMIGKDEAVKRIRKGVEVIRF
jgi:glutamyl-tRNA synthetase